jgi:hypothetical protein
VRHEQREQALVDPGAVHALGHLGRDFVQAGPGRPDEEFELHGYTALRTETGPAAGPPGI